MIWKKSEKESNVLQIAHSKNRRIFQILKKTKDGYSLQRFVGSISIGGAAVSCGYFKTITEAKNHAAELVRSHFMRCGTPRVRL